MLCENCKKRATCKEICRELENYLQRKDKDRLYSDRWIRHMEAPYAPLDIDEYLPKKVIERVRGRRKRKHSSQ